MTKQDLIQFMISTAYNSGYVAGQESITRQQEFERRLEATGNKALKLTQDKFIAILEQMPRTDGDKLIDATVAIDFIRSITND